MYYTGESSSRINKNQHDSSDITEHPHDEKPKCQQTYCTSPSMPTHFHEVKMREDMTDEYKFLRSIQLRHKQLTYALCRSSCVSMESKQHLPYVFSTFAT